MKKLFVLLVFAWCLALPAPVHAQCSGQFQPGQVCGNNSTTPGFPSPIPTRLLYTSAPTIYVNGVGIPAICTLNSAATSPTCAVGNDTTGVGTIAAPYQTLTKAIAVVRSFDWNGFTPQIVLAYGSSANYAALCVGAPTGAQLTGGNDIFVSGDQNSPTSVSILAPSAGEGVYASDWCIARLSFVQIDNQGGATDGVRIGQGAIIDINDITCGASWNSSGAPCVVLEKGGVANFAGAVGINALGCGSSLVQMTGGTFNAAGVNPPFPKRTITIPSAIACTNGTFNLTGPARLMNFNASTFTGAGVAGTTGVRAILTGPGWLDGGGSSVNSIFPGNSPALLTQGWQDDAGDNQTSPLPAGGVACSGSPSSSFAVVNGIVTHC